MKIYPLIVPFVLGVIFTVFCYQAFTIYELRSTVATDHATITSVVSFLNSQLQASQTQQSQTQQATQQTNAVSTGAPTKR